MVDYIISEYITREGIGKLEELAPIYKAKVNTPKKITAFNELCDKWHKIAPGTTLTFIHLQGYQREGSSLIRFLSGSMSILTTGQPGAVLAVGSNPC